MNDKYYFFTDEDGSLLLGSFLAEHVSFGELLFFLKPILSSNLNTYKIIEEETISLSDFSSYLYKINNVSLLPLNLKLFLFNQGIETDSSFPVNCSFINSIEKGFYEIQLIVNNKTHVFRQNLERVL